MGEEAQGHINRGGRKMSKPYPIVYFETEYCEMLCFSCSVKMVSDNRIDDPHVKVITTEVSAERRDTRSFKCEACGRYLY